MRNNNGASIRRLSMRSLKNNRVRNLFAVIAIALTGILFTAVFSLADGAMQTIQEETMREVGGKYHAGIKAASMEQYEKVAADPSVRESNYTILIGRADNILKRQAEIRYTPQERTLSEMFITLEEGGMPQEADEVIVDTFVLDELGLPHRLGEEIPLRFSFMGETIEEVFTVCGWYEGDAVAHASELFVSERYWTALKDSYTDEDFMKWKEEHPEDAGAGLIAGNFFFEDTHDLEEKVRTIIRNAGYEPETELAYGVNWAYMSNRAEAADPVTLTILSGAVFVILLTGYLIIYNIFQISVISDIRFYGLLKTIGTTKMQISRLVRRQALILAAVGIPIGLLIGFGVGRAVLPFMMSLTDSWQGMEISLKCSPRILISGAAFSGFTVWLSSRKPGKIAGSVSPIDALRYVETERKGQRAGKSRRKKQNTRGRFDALSMALSNLSRNRRTGAVVIAAISLSMILLTIVMTAVGSFQTDQYIDQRIVGDFVLGNIGVISSAMGNGAVETASEYLALADGQEGIEGRTEMRVRFRSFLKLDEKASEQLKKLDGKGMLRRDAFAVENLEKMLSGEKDFDGCFYAYSEELLPNLEVLDGTLDIGKFRTGNYILLATISGSEEVLPEEHIYHPGDKVTVESFGENSSFHENRDASGTVIDIVYDDLVEKEYEVMAIVRIPTSMDLHRYRANVCDVVLPLTEFETDEENVQTFGVSYRVAEEQKDAFEAVLQAYTDRNPEMGYVSRESLKKEFDGMTMIIAFIGITLAAVIALIGILNFTNAMITEIIVRKQEFAVMQSIGMTDSQLLKTLIYEGISYIAISGMINVTLGGLLSWIILKAMSNMILFFEYRFQILPFVIMIPVMMSVAVLVPVLAWRSVRKKSIVERLRESE